MFTDFKFELFEKDGKQYLYMSSDGSSGTRIEVYSKEDILKWINCYVGNVLDEIMEEDN
jgi:hypothetical protein